MHSFTLLKVGPGQLNVEAIESPLDPASSLRVRYHGRYFWSAQGSIQAYEAATSTLQQWGFPLASLNLGLPLGPRNF